MGEAVGTEIDRSGSDSDIRARIWTRRAADTKKLPGVDAGGPVRPGEGPERAPEPLEQSRPREAEDRFAAAVPGHVPILPSSVGIEKLGKRRSSHRPGQSPNRKGTPC